MQHIVRVPSHALQHLLFNWISGVVGGKVCIYTSVHLCSLRSHLVQCCVRLCNLIRCGCPFEEEVLYASMQAHTALPCQTY